MAQYGQDFLDDCSCAELLDDAKCFRDPCVGENLRNAVQIVLLNYIVAQLNETDVYTLDELIKMGKCCECGVNEMDRDAIMTYMLYAIAQQVGDPPDTGELTEEACRLNCTPEQKTAILLAMWCRLFKAFGDLESERLPT